jgi:hypothetical protein
MTAQVFAQIKLSVFSFMASGSVPTPSTAINNHAISFGFVFGFLGFFLRWGSHELFAQAGFKP